MGEYIYSGSLSNNAFISINYDFANQRFAADFKPNNSEYFPIDHSHILLHHGWPSIRVWSAIAEHVNLEDFLLYYTEI